MLVGKNDEIYPMNKDQEILDQIKKTVHRVVPNARVVLFGSRVSGNIHAESDWDILVLTKEEPARDLKNELIDKLYGLISSTGQLISPIIISESEWENNAAFYSLQKSIKSGSVNL